MSSGADVGRRPNLWSYFSFSGPRRRISVSLPRNEPPARSGDADPFEKPDRHSHHRSSSSMTDYKGGAMNQGQRVRYLKTGGIIAFVILALYFFAPRDALSKGMRCPFLRIIRTNWNSSTCVYRRQHGIQRRRIAKVHQIFLERETSHPICPHDRRRQHRFPHPRLQV
jgi:hypothetical protein